MSRLPDSITVWGEGGCRIGTAATANAYFADVRTQMRLVNECVSVTLSAQTTPISYVTLQWTVLRPFDEPVKVLGDAWERGYGDLEWKEIDPNRMMPWYFLVSNGSDSNRNYAGRLTRCYGVRVRPSAFCAWSYDGKTVTLKMDVRNGGSGVILSGRVVKLCEIVFETYNDISAFEADCRFCKLLCNDPILPKAPVYGFNNWYYAYGVSSEKEILADAHRLSALSANCEARPYMVIDDGWQVVFNDGPWHRGNEKFPNMPRLAANIKAENVRPGIWVRPLRQKPHPEQKIPAEWRFRGTEEFLDPSHPEVLKFIDGIFRRVVDWGYELIKYDFVTNDIFWKWGMECPAFMGEDGWHFYDRSRTTAEIIIELYKTIRRASGNAVLIGCNAVSHLCAGLVEVNRTGDDTSGREWERTRKMGVNTLAFRMSQNRAFYLADADCVGLTKEIAWEHNEQWLHALEQSGTALFISWDSTHHTDAIEAAVRAGLQYNSRQDDVMQPLDWMETLLPQSWLVNGVETTFHWE